MKPTRRLALGTLTALAVLGATTGAGAEAVTIPFTVNAATGNFSVAAVTTTGSSAGSVSFSTSDQSLTGNVPELTVTDGRGTLSTWTLTASGTAFDNSGPAATNAVVFFPVDTVANLLLDSALADGTDMTLTTCYCAATGAAAEALLGTTNLGSAYTLATGAATSLLNASPSIDLNADIQIKVPGSTGAGTYTTTLTFSVT